MLTVPLPRYFLKSPSDDTIRREISGLLKPALAKGVKEKLYRGPAPELSAPSAGGHRYRFLTRAEAARLIVAARRDPRARHHLPYYILLGLYTGARPMALLDLTWPQVDLVHGFIDLNPPGRAQTKKRRPKVPMHPRLQQHLRRLQARADSLYVLTYTGRKAGPAEDKTPSYRLGSIDSGFGSAVKRVGLNPPGTPSELRVVPYTLRHTAASWWSMGGMTMREIGDLLGQSTAKVTERYAHLSPTHLRQAMAKVIRPGAVG